MKHLKSFTVIWLVSLLVVGMLFAGQQKAGAVERGDTLIVAVIELPPTIDVQRMTHPISHFLTTSLGELMVWFPRKPSTQTEGVRVLDFTKPLVPRSAESYEISPDNKTITFHLRKGIKSAYGNEFGANDVYWTWERGLAIHGVAEFYFGVMDMPGPEAMKIIDDYTISFTANRPNALLAMVHALVTPFPLDSAEAKKHATEDDPWANDYITHHAPGFGPYYVAEWTPGVQAVFNANPNYYRIDKGEPHFKKVIFKVVPESSSRVALIRDGTVDAVHQLSPREVDSLRGTPGVKAIVEKGLWLNHLVLNDLVVPQFGDKLVRQAINYAIDREKIIDMAYYGMAEPMDVVYPKQRPGALDPSAFPYRYDIEKAKELMQKSGYGDGFDVELWYEAGVLPHETASVIIKEDLAKIGVNVSLRKTPIGALETMVRTKKVSMAMWRETPFAPDPNYACTLMYLGASKPGSYCNYSGFDNEVINNMIMEGKAIVDWEKRLAHHKELQKIILEEAPVGFIVQESLTTVSRDDIKGWNFDIGEVTKYAELYRE
jgi:peptide/nickel transport system substrate-binding protein